MSQWDSCQGCGTTIHKYDDWCDRPNCKPEYLERKAKEKVVTDSLVANGAPFQHFLREFENNSAERKAINALHERISKIEKQKPMLSPCGEAHGLSPVKITISGLGGTGKSAIAQYISEHLAKIGFTAILDDTDAPRNQDDLHRVLGTMNKNLLVQVKTPVRRSKRD